MILGAQKTLDQSLFNAPKIMKNIYTRESCDCSKIDQISIMPNQNWNFLGKSIQNRKFENTFFDFERVSIEFSIENSKSDRYFIKHNFLVDKYF